MGSQADEAGFIAGVRDIGALNDTLVRQDEALRTLCETADSQLRVEHATLMALCAIHERLGNMMIAQLQSH